MDFDAVCLSVSQQKCDIAMAGLTINEEREEYVTFTDSYYSASQRLIVPSDNTAFDDCKSADDVAALLAKTGREAGIAEGREAGIVEGKQREIEKVILNMHKKGYSLEQIMDATELEEIGLKSMIKKLK